MDELGRIAPHLQLYLPEAAAREGVDGGREAADKGEEVHECGVKKNLTIIDLTGAGDLFAAGFLHGYINKLSIGESLEKGTEMSSKIIQKIGARL